MIDNIRAPQTVITNAQFPGSISAAYSVSAAAIASSGQVSAGAVHSSGGVDGAFFADTGAAPTIAANSGAGTGASASFVGPAHDLLFHVTLTVGKSPSGNSPIFIVTFSTNYDNPPVFTCYPMNSTAAALAVSRIPYITTTTSNLVFHGQHSALAKGASYEWAFSGRKP